MRWLLVLVLLAAGAAQAAMNSRTLPVPTMGPGGRVTVLGGTGDLVELLSKRDYVPVSGGIDGSVLLKDLLRGPANLSGGTMDVTMSRVATSRALGRAVMRGLPLVGTALAVKDLLDELECVYQPGNDPLRCSTDFGQGLSTPGTYSYSRDGTGVWYPSPAAVAGAMEAPAAAYYSGTNYTNTGSTCPLPVSWGFAGNPDLAEIGCIVHGVRERISAENWVERGDLVVPIGIRRTALQVPLKTCAGIVLDGLCRIVPTEEEFEDRVANDAGALPKLMPIPELLDAAGEPYELTPPQLSGPSRVGDGRVSTEDLPNGGKRTVDRDWDITYHPEPMDFPWYDIKQRDTTREWPPGVTPDPYEPPDGQGNGGSGSAPGGTTTTTKIEFKTCGLPGTPPCKIDESGTPTGAGATTAAGGQIDGGASGRIGELGQLGSQTTGGPAWSWTFQLPTGCSAIPTPAFARFGLPEVSVCPYQPMIHDVMSMLWLMTTVIGCAGMVSRTLRGG